MLACLKKDVYTMWGYCKYLLLCILLFTLIPYLSGDTDMSFYAVYPRLFAGMIPLTIYTYDEREHWCAYAATLPISRRTYVLGKYLLGLILSVVLLLLSSLLNLLFAIMGRKTMELAPGMGLSMSLAIPALTMPFLFLFGAEKGRIVYLIGIAVGSALAVMVIGEVPQLSPVGNGSLFAGTLALYAISAFLSAAFYARREL